MNVLAGMGDGAFGLIGQNSNGATNTINGSISFGLIGGNVNVLGGPGLGMAFAQIGPDGANDILGGTLGGIVFTTVEGDVNVTGGFGLNSPDFASAQIGPSAGGLIGNEVMGPIPNPYDITFTNVGGSVSVTGGAGFNSCSMIGQQGGGVVFGNIVLDNVALDVNVAGAGGGSLSQECYGQLGQFGDT